MSEHGGDVFAAGVSPESEHGNACAAGESLMSEHGGDVCAAGRSLESEHGGDVKSATPVESRTGGVVVRIKTGCIGDNTGCIDSLMFCCCGGSTV